MELNRSARVLVDEVERGFGKNIREERLSPADTRLGASQITQDGTPVVLVNPNHIDLDVIVHELYHLKLKLQGYPVVSWTYPPSMDTDGNNSTRDFLSLSLYDPIIHFIFRNESVEHGIDPAKSYKEQVIQLLQNGSIETASLTQSDRFVALNFFHALIEFGKGDVISTIENLLKRIGKASAIELGWKMYEIVEQGKPSSPQTAIETFVACLNFLYQGQLTFREIQPWIVVRKGAFNEVLATINMEALPNRNPSPH